ncbi:MAG: hypothetical protein WC969_06645 [Elusimicrobiota bacterium]
MEKDKAEKSEKSEKTKKPEMTTAMVAHSLEQLVLDRRDGKYEIVAPISYYAKELRKLEEHRHLTQTDLLERAMHDVLAGKVSMKDLEKRMRECPHEVPSSDPNEKPRREKRESKGD